jgi:acyl-CoA synthetase (AMP-forming)/AMP-acid ligase II
VVPEEPGADIGDPAGELARSLPRQMVPAAVHRVGAIPLNANGKIDRAALTARLAEEPR